MGEEVTYRAVGTAVRARRSSEHLRHSGAAAAESDGHSTVRHRDVDGATPRVEGGDLVDGTPVLDVKPYASTRTGVEFEECHAGWLRRTPTSRSTTRVRRSDADAGRSAETPFRSVDRPTTP